MEHGGDVRYPVAFAVTPPWVNIKAASTKWMLEMTGAHTISKDQECPCQDIGPSMRIVITQYILMRGHGQSCERKGKLTNSIEQWIQVASQVGSVLCPSCQGKGLKSGAT